MVRIAAPTDHGSKLPGNLRNRLAAHADPEHPQIDHRDGSEQQRLIRRDARLQQPERYMY